MLSVWQYILYHNILDRQERFSELRECDSLGSGLICLTTFANINGNFSIQAKVEFGVPQGSGLGPLVHFLNKCYF